MIEVWDLQSGYADICAFVLYEGEETAPRGKLTKEVLGETIVITDITRSLPLHVGRGCNPNIGAVEAVQLIGGFSDPQLTVAVAPNMKEFLTDSINTAPYFHGAYGTRAHWQYQHVVQKLKNDRDSRQAVITIWDPALDLVATQPDLPCTVSLHFLIRDNKLVLHTHMRSNDVWWGLAYDVFQFTQLQLTVARQLGIEAGKYYHHDTSLHIYERDWDKVDALHAPDELMTPLWGFTDFDTAWKIGHNMKTATALTETEEWYVDRLAPYVG